MSCLRWKVSVARREGVRRRSGRRCGEGGVAEDQWWTSCWCKVLSPGLAGAVLSWSCDPPADAVSVISSFFVRVCESLERRRISG